MTSTPKRLRLSATSAALEATKNLQAAGPEPTEPLTQEESIVFDAVVTGRERSTWSDHDLGVATSLSKQIVMHRRLLEVVAREGVMIEHDKKGLIAHPAIGASVTLAGAIKGQATLLGLSASQRGLAGARQQVRNDHEQVLRDALANTSAGLLA
jgi:hypothetical protein